MANNIILPFSELQAELNDEAMIDPNAIIEITENGRYNVARYGYADVDVPQPSGKITITENGTDIDVSEYATADVIVEGGGGSSDFSTAEVTITGIGEGATVSITGCYCFNDYNLLLPFAEIRDGVYTVPLYKGTVVFLPDPDLVYTLSGNATDNDGIFITGDCTITIS